MASRVETKVVAATVGSGGGAAIGTFGLWLLGVTVWHESNAADNASNAIAAVPAPVSGLLLLVVAGVGAYVSGWLAPHTSRTDAPVLPAPVVEQEQE
jgi:hypothetical protein